MSQSKPTSMKIKITENQSIQEVIQALINLGYRKVLWNKQWERSKHMEVITYTESMWFSNFNRNVPKNESCKITTLSELRAMYKPVTQPDLFEVAV